MRPSAEVVLAARQEAAKTVQQQVAATETRSGDVGFIFTHVIRPAIEAAARPIISGAGFLAPVVESLLSEVLGAVGDAL